MPLKAGAVTTTWLRSIVWTCPVRTFCPQKFSNVVLRVSVDLASRARLLDFALLHHRDKIGKGDRLKLGEGYMMKVPSWRCIPRSSWRIWMRNCSSRAEIVIVSYPKTASLATSYGDD